MRAMSAPTTRPRKPGILLAAALIAFLGFAVGPAAHPAPAAASTASYMEGLIVKWVNNARANRGIAPLRVTTRLTNLAGDRSATLVSTHDLLHPGCLSCMFTSGSSVLGACGESIAWTIYSWCHGAD